MTVYNSKREAVDDALSELGFSLDATFGAFTTYERKRDSVKVHVGPDGSFAAFGRDDEILGEGEDAEDLRFVLVGLVSA